MNPKIAVAGGTGLVGSMVVAEARAAGREPVVLARSTGVDLRTGVGLDAALDGVDAVIDVINIDTQRRRRAVELFGTATATLLRAEERAGVRHHVMLSIVGIDRVDTGYYAGKRRAEEVVTGGRVPWTILRSTQFHEFADLLLGLVPGPVVVVPTMLSRPVAAREVARHLVTLAGGPAAGRTRRSPARRSGGWPTWCVGWPAPADPAGRCWNCRCWARRPPRRRGARCSRRNPVPGGSRRSNSGWPEPAGPGS